MGGRRYDEQYSLPTELTAETKIFKFFTIKMLIVLFAFGYLGMQLSTKVYLPLKVPFIIFSLIVGILFCINSQRNKKKKLYQSVIIMFTRDKHFYKPIEKPVDKLPTTKEEIIGKMVLRDVIDD